MSVRPPTSFWRPAEIADPVTAALDHEVRAEKAGTLGRLLQRLDQKLAAVRALQDDPHLSDRDRDRILNDAGETLWHVVIQRELCGFGRTQDFFRERQIPRAVQVRMGVRSS